MSRIDIDQIKNLPVKEAVRVTTTANITLSGLQTIDGVSAVAGDRVLVKDQSTASANGIYVVASGAWSRALDSDKSEDWKPNVLIGVQEGTANADKFFFLTTNGAITIGTTSLSFSALGAATISTLSNKDMTASVTTTDGSLACATAISATPANDGYVEVKINGVLEAVGDGVKTKSCYFSSDSGTTAKSIANIASGDSLYWNGSIAGYQLKATDRVDLSYLT